MCFVPFFCFSALAECDLWLKKLKSLKKRKCTEQHFWKDRSVWCPAVCLSEFSRYASSYSQIVLFLNYELLKSCWCHSGVTACCPEEWRLSRSASLAIWRCHFKSLKTRCISSFLAQLKCIVGLLTECWTPTTNWMQRFVWLADWI